MQPDAGDARDVDDAKDKEYVGAWRRLAEHEEKLKRWSRQNKALSESINTDIATLKSSFRTWPTDAKVLEEEDPAAEAEQWLARELKIENPSGELGMLVAAAARKAEVRLVIFHTSLGVTNGCCAGGCARAGWMRCLWANGAHVWRDMIGRGVLAAVV